MDFKKIPFFMGLMYLSMALSGQSFYFEYKMTGRDSVSGFIKSYSSDGSSRTEMQMQGRKSSSVYRWVTLTLKERPLKSFVLNENEKLYSEIDMSATAAKEKDSTGYEVTLAGKEKINGYDCTHVIVRKKTSANVEELWLSADLQNYKTYLTVRNTYTTEGLYKAIASRGVTGFPIRIIATDKGKTMQVDLVKAGSRNNAPSLFSLSGFSKSATVGGTSTPKKR